MRRDIASAIACCLLVACGRTTTDTAAHRATHASSSAVASSAATGAADPAALSTSVAHAVDPLLPKDAFVLPGAIHAGIGLADLRRIYGTANVETGAVPSGNGESERGVALFPGDPPRRAFIYFRDPKTLTGLDMIGILDTGSFWRSAQGVRVGMPLAELVALNGKPFAFYGFEGSYGGWVSDWMGGRLATPADAAALHVRLSHSIFLKDVPYNELPYENYRSYRSDQPQLARMNVVVDEITLDLPGQDNR